MVPTGEVSNLPPAFRASYDNCVRDFVTADRGQVRANNDKTFDSRAEVFTDWCTDMEFSEHDLRQLDDRQCLMVLGTFVREVKLGYNKKQLTDMTADTIRGYLTSAHRYLELLLGRHIPIMDPNHGGKSQRYHPFLSEQLADRRRWTKPKPRYEPYTVEMFVSLEQYLSTFKDSLSSFVSLEHCVYDWARLGVFTGSRLGEYGQSQLLAGRSFNTIPHNHDVPEQHRGEPLAFVASDFTFYDENFIQIPHRSVFHRHCKGQVKFVEILWRYDKSASNFVRRKFAVTGHPIFDPVDAAVSIIQRQLFLEVPSTHPIGVWSSSPSQFRFLKDREVTKIMRKACEWAYPDPKHYMRLHIKRIVPHSNRVTAAVCLQQGGASNDEIAFKLRWHLTSVPTYLRDCFQAVGDTLAKSVQGVFKMAFSSS